MDAVRLFDDQDWAVKVTWEKPDGTPAQVDGPTRWSTTDNAVCDVLPDPKHPTDTSRALLRAIASPSGAFSTRECDVRAAADADLGDGVVEVVALIRVAVQPAMADHGTVDGDGAPFTRGQDPRPDPVVAQPEPQPVTTQPAEGAQPTAAAAQPQAAPAA